MVFESSRLPMLNNMYNLDASEYLFVIFEKQTDVDLSEGSLSDFVDYRILFIGNFSQLLAFLVIFETFLLIHKI